MTTRRCFAICKAVAIALCFQISSAQAQVNPDTPVDGRTNAILTAVPFLRIVPDARSGALGDAGIALTPDPNAMHFNASNLAFGEKDFSMSATYTPWLRALGLSDVYLAYLSMYKRLDKVQTLGFGLRYFSLGQINFTDENGQPLGGARPNEFELALAYARVLGKNLSVGLTMKYIYSRLAVGQFNGQDFRPGNAVASDLSLTWRRPLPSLGAGSMLRVGAAVTNLGTKITYTSSANRDFIPTNLGVGAAFAYNFDDINSITLLLDVNRLLVPTPDTIDSDADGVFDYRQVSVPAGVFGSFSDAPGGATEELREFMYSIGVEYSYDNQFFVRAGHFNEHRLKGNRKYFAVGVGLKYNIFGLNFSYLIPTQTGQRNPLDNTLRFSVLFDFNAVTDDAKPGNL